MQVCRAAADANRNDVARAQAEADEKYQGYIAAMADQINQHHAMNREQLVSYGQAEMRHALKAQEDALAAQFGVMVQDYESQIQRGRTQVMAAETEA